MGGGWWGRSVGCLGGHGGFSFLVCGVRLGWGVEWDGMDWGRERGPGEVWDVQ